MPKDKKLKIIVIEREFYAISKKGTKNGAPEFLINAVTQDSIIDWAEKIGPVIIDIPNDQESAAWDKWNQTDASKGVQPCQNKDQ